MYLGSLETKMKSAMKNYFKCRFFSINTALMTVVLMQFAGIAWADVQLELGARFEALTLDEGITFTCPISACQSDDSACRMMEESCSGASINEAQEGIMFGGVLGIRLDMSPWTMGIRLVASIGRFKPQGEVDKETSTTLTHVSFEIPLEANISIKWIEFFVQVTPRLGLMNYSFNRDSVDNRAVEDPDTVTLGVLLSAGIRLGDGDWRFGAQGGYVAHPYISGHMIQATTIRQ
jgi:hypothetical protein